MHRSSRVTAMAKLQPTAPQHTSPLRGWNATSLKHSWDRFETWTGPKLNTIASTPWGRIALAGFTIGAFLWVYSYVNRSTPPRMDFYTPLDGAIPFLPSTILIYLSMYGLFGFAAIYIEPRDFLRGLGTLLIVCFVSLGFYIAIPAHYPRPDAATVANPLFRWMYATMFAFDAPGNTFPSLHVGTTTTAALMLQKTRLRWLFTVWAVLICLSTMTVKQHFIADVIGGVLLAAVVFRIMKAPSVTQRAPR